MIAAFMVSSIYYDKTRSRFGADPADSHAQLLRGHAGPPPDDGGGDAALGHSILVGCAAHAGLRPEELRALLDDAAGSASRAVLAFRLERMLTDARARRRAFHAGGRAAPGGGIAGRPHDPRLN